MPVLEDYFLTCGHHILDDRDRRYREINTPEKVQTLQQELRAVARNTFGEYVLSQAETNTPPRILKTGQIETTGVIIEKFLFEAFHDFWVPTLLYRPDRDIGKCPALVMPVGHWWEGKALPMYQQLMRILARRGVICASFDSCGQGERTVWFNPAVQNAMRRLAETHPAGSPAPYPLQPAACHGFWAANNVTSAHCVIGDPGYLCGVHQHALTAVAGKRLIDLLSHRRDVVTDKIGACGASGGGTDTRFLGALDKRVALAVVASIMGSTRSLSGGDADQSFFFTINKGISQTDLIACLAPKPLLIVSASADKHDTASVANFYRPLWSAFGKGDHIVSGIGQGAHGFPLESRKIIAEFVLHHLRGEKHTIPDSEHADTFPLLSERELQTTFSGNLFSDGVGKGPVDLIRERARSLARQRRVPDGDALRKVILTTLCENEDSLQHPPENVCKKGSELTWEGEGSVPLKMVCEGSGPSVALLTHEDGGEAACSSPLYDILRQTGSVIARLDVRGTGISATSEPEPNSAFLGPLLMGTQASLARLVLHQGRTLTGMRTVDLIQAAAVLGSHAATAPTDKPALDLIAEGGMGFAALIAAYLYPDLFSRVILYRTPVSWMELATTPGRAYNFAHYLFGVLERFDTSDITRVFPQGKVIWINPTDGAGNVISKSAARKCHRAGTVRFELARVPSGLLKWIKREFQKKGHSV
jgi:hypothetical protein